MTEPELDDEAVMARATYLARLQRSCGHDMMKRIGAGPHWQCSLCGQLQDEHQPGGLRQPGTYKRGLFENEALGTALAEWTRP